MKTADLWIRSGLVWLIGAMCYGAYLGITEKFNLQSSHAHTALLGGVWSMLFSWLFVRRGDPPLSGGGKVQWACYNLGVLAMVAGFAVLNSGGPGLMLMVPGLLLVLGMTIWIAATVWPRRT